MKSVLQRRIVLTEQSRKIIEGLNARIAKHEATIARLEAEVEALRNPWNSDMAAKPRGKDVLVYQPATMSGRTSLPARITMESNAGYVRETTHWMVPVPPRTEGERA